MKLLLFPALTLCLLSGAIHAQQPADTYQYFNAQWKPAKEKSAIYVLRIHFTHDSCWQYSYYYKLSTLIRIETYLDQQRTTRHGLFSWYNQQGEMDSSGYFYKGLPDKDWFYPALTTSKYYDKGKLLSEDELHKKLEKEALIDPAFPDLSRPTPESYFPGGVEEWQKYLNKNLHYPEVAVDNIVQGTVVTIFIVQPTGKIDDVRLLQSVELSVDDEAIRLMENSPAWVPAIRGDHKVRSFKEQPVAFRLDFSNAR